MTFAARTSFLGLVAVIALATAAGADPSQGQQTQQMQQMEMHGPGGNLLWLKPTAGQQACPAGQALAVATNAAGEQTGKPKCMPKPQGEQQH